jgi:hypothetical protein
MFQHQHEAIKVAADCSTFFRDFANALDARKTFDEACFALLTQARRFEMAYVRFGIISELPLQLTNGAKLLKDDNARGIMYLACGDAKESKLRLVCPKTRRCEKCQRSSLGG